MQTALSELCGNTQTLFTHETLHTTRITATTERTLIPKACTFLPHEAMNFPFVNH